MAYYTNPKNLIDNQILTNGLIFYVDASKTKSYPATGTAWTDISTNAFSGTLTNGPTYSAGSILFDGSDDYVTFGSVSLGITNTVTVSIWINFATLTNNNYYTFFSFGGWTANSFIIQRAGDSGDPLRLAWNGNTWTDGPIFRTGSAWKNIVVVINAGAVSKWYVNNVSTNGTGTTFSVSNPKTLELGRRGDSGGLQYTNAYIGECQVYNRALSANEVSYNYNIRKGRYGLS